MGGDGCEMRLALAVLAILATVQSLPGPDQIVPEEERPQEASAKPLSHVNLDLMEHDTAANGENGRFHPFKNTPLFSVKDFRMYNQTKVHHLIHDGLWLNICVSNPRTKDQKFLVRDTPYDVEKVAGDIELSQLVGSNMFHVTETDGMRNPKGDDLKYIGADVKLPAIEEETSRGFVLKQDDSKCTVVNIASLYAFPNPGHYRISLRQPRDGHLQYMNVSWIYVELYGEKEMEEMLQSRRDAFWKRHEHNTVSSMVQTTARAGSSVTRRRRDSSFPLTYTDCDASQQTELENMHKNAMSWLETSAGVDHSNPIVKDWFGLVSVNDYTGVINSFNTMMDKAENVGVKYICEDSHQSGTNCNNGGAANVFAYVYPSSSTPIVYMCSMVMSYNPKSERYQTVIHELSHFDNIGDTSDVGYGESTCKSLVGSSPTSAIQNADSQGYFTKYATGAATRRHLASVVTLFLCLCAMVVQW